MKIPVLGENEKILILRVSKSFNAKAGEDSRYIRENVYERVRKYWRADIKRVSNAEIVLGVANGTVVAVYRPIKWDVVDYYGGKRCVFEGVEVFNSEYFGLDLSEYLRGSNPVTYVNF